MKFYADFIKEREGLDLLEFPEGFITYQITNDELYVANLYIAPEFRGTPALFRFDKEITKIAVENKCKLISSNIHLNDHGFNRTLRAALKLLFTVVSAHNNSVIVVKKIGGSHG